MKLARRQAIAATLCAVFFGYSVPRLLAQAERPTFRTSVTLVPITAVVHDAKNRVVRELQRDDFEVFEDNRLRRVVDFSATDRGPVSLAILFDTSGSMRGPNLDAGRLIVNELLDQLGHVADEASLFTFDKTVRQHTPFSNDRDPIRRALGSTEGWGVTSLYDAMAETAKFVGARRAARRALVVITDGVDTSSALGPTDVSGLASAIDVPVYVMNVVPPETSQEDLPEDGNDGGLSNLAYWTGGALRHARTSEQAALAVVSLMTELRQQAFLAIESASASGWYRLDVRTKRRGLTVRARSGYFASTSLPPQAGEWPAFHP